MKIDGAKLGDLLRSLSADQRRLVNESLGGVRNIDPAELADLLSSDEALRSLRAAIPVTDAGTTDAGTGNAGTGPAPDPPLTRW